MKRTADFGTISTIARHLELNRIASRAYFARPEMILNRVSDPRGTACSVTIGGLGYALKELLRAVPQRKRAEAALTLRGARRCARELAAQLKIAE